MGSFEWDPKLETGVAVIDQQHRELFRRLDELQLAIYGAKAKNELVVMIEYLEKYVDEHFAAEEKMMFGVRFHDYSGHKREHEEFKRIFQRIRDEYRVKGADNFLAIQLEKEVYRWWEDHIMRTDMTFAAVVRAHVTRGSGSAPERLKE